MAKCSGQLVTATREFCMGRIDELIKEKLMNQLSKVADHTNGNCHQAWHFIEMCRSHYKNENENILQNIVQLGKKDGLIIT